MRINYFGSGRRSGRTSGLHELIKRGFDVICSLLALLFLSPLVVFVFLLTMLVSRQSMLRRVQYYDLNGRPFEVFQFQCSVADTDRNRGQGSSWIDQFLDRSSFNELLLLINVLRGDMSLVGPRPLLQSWGAAYRARMPATYLRGVRPGLVSWAQIGETRDKNSANDRLRRNIEHDCYYLANRSFWFDLKILFLAVLSIRPHP